MRLVTRLMFGVIVFASATGSFYGFAEENLKGEADTLARQGEYQKAYEKLLSVVENLESDITNLKGLVEYYKEQAEKSSKPSVSMDYTYNEAANALWASAWALQHDGVFKKTGQEKEDCLRRAVDTYRRIVVDYPNSAKSEEAQYRIARIYYKFLKDKEKANEEYQKYLNQYPNGKFSGEAAETIMRLRGKDE